MKIVKTEGDLEKDLRILKFLRKMKAHGNRMDRRKEGQVIRRNEENVEQQEGKTKIRKE